MKISTAAVLLFAAMPLHADGILAVLKNPNTVERRDAQSGAFKGSVSVNKAIGVGCDGETIAILLAGGTIARYDAKNGAFRGSISLSGKPSAVLGSGGIIAATTERGMNRYNASSDA
jgi:hypothetical protein